MYVCMYVCIYVLMYICTYVHMYTRVCVLPCVVESNVLVCNLCAYLQEYVHAYPYIPKLNTMCRQTRTSFVSRCMYILKYVTYHLQDLGQYTDYSFDMYIRRC